MLHGCLMSGVYLLTGYIGVDMIIFYMTRNESNGMHIPLQQVRVMRKLLLVSHPLTISFLVISIISQQ